MTKKIRVKPAANPVPLGLQGYCSEEMDVDLTAEVWKGIQCGELLEVKPAAPSKPKPKPRSVDKDPEK